MQTIKATLLPFLAAITLLACGPENDILRNQTPASGARVKVLHTIPDGPAIDLFVNDTKLNGAAVTYGTNFPGNEYAVLTPGSAVVRVSTVASGTVVAQTILSATAPVEADKYYTVAAAGTAAAPTAVVFNDDLSLPDASKAYYRVINLVSGGPAVDFAIGTSAPLITNVATGKASDFVAVNPTTSISPYSLQVRSTGTTTLIGTAIANATAGVGRKYTILVRGIAGRMGTQAPTAGLYTTR
ncbi:DUF4397 domain-containing protein [Spirosoma arcticum]